MAPRKLVFAQNGEQEDKKQTPDTADEELSEEESSSDSDSEGEDTALLPLKKPKFGASRDLIGPGPGENGSACSSPTASGFIIMPAVKSSGKKKRKKAPTSRKFSDEDEIGLLKGLAVFWADGRNNKWTEFHKFIKGSLTNQFTKVQVSEKIRSLKKKFETNFGKDQANGGRLDFSDSHESVLFELSRRLWGDDKGISQQHKKGAEIEHEESNKQSGKRKQLNEHKQNEVNKKPRKRKQVDGNHEEDNILEQEKEVDEHHNQEDDIPENQKQEGEGEGNEEPENGKQVKEIEKEDFQSAFPLLYASFGMFGYPKIAKEKCVLIPREKAQELEEKWRELNADAARLELKKIELIKRDLQDRLERK